MAERGDARLSEYIKRVRAIPRLTRAEEAEVATRAREGDREATERLVEANLRYVVAVALQYRRYGIPVWELIEEGSVGLMLAIRKFEPARGNRFVTYAGYWIRAYVLDLVVRSTSMVGAGSGALRSKLFFRLRRERARAAAQVRDEDARLELLAERFGVDPQRMQTLLSQLDARDVSLDGTVHPDSGTTLVEMLRDEDHDQERDLLAQERDSRLSAGLGRALSVLDRRERMIVEERIMADDGASLAELGRRLGVSRERARQLEARAKRKLRECLSLMSPDVVAA